MISTLSAPPPSPPSAPPPSPPILVQQVLRVGPTRLRMSSTCPQYPAQDAFPYCVSTSWPPLTPRRCDTTQSTQSRRQSTLVRNGGRKKCEVLWGHHAPLFSFSRTPPNSGDARCSAPLCAGCEHAGTRWGARWGSGWGTSRGVRREARWGNAGKRATEPKLTETPINCTMHGASTASGLMRGFGLEFSMLDSSQLLPFSRNVISGLLKLANRFPTTESKSLLEAVRTQSRARVNASRGHAGGTLGAR